MRHTIQFLKGYVFIRTPKPLDAVAEQISWALSINLEEAKVGRFEEYEGYLCDAMGFTIYLVGDDLSKPRPTSHKYELSIAPSAKLAYEDNAGFEEVDVSSFLEWALRRIPDLEITT